MTPQSDNQIKLRDGRRLGYAEFGDPRGKPVLFFHGYPGSRWDGAETGHAAERVGVRLIAPDRPGMGLSDYQPKRRLLDWPTDVLELANALGFDHFAVIGYSGGGPYALACAFKLDMRLSAVGVIAGIGPLTEPGAVDGMVKNNIQLFQMARRTPWLLRLIFSLNRRMDSLKLMQAAVPQLPAVDQDVMGQPGVLAGMAKDYSEAFRQARAAWCTKALCMPAIGVSSLVRSRTRSGCGRANKTPMYQPQWGGFKPATCLIVKPLSIPLTATSRSLSITLPRS